MNTTKTTRTLRLAACFALAALLAACGGGGAPAAADTPAPSSTPAAPAPSTATPQSYALVTSIPAATYATGTGAADIYAAVNAARLAVGVGALTQSPELDQSAAAHLNYMALNYPSGLSHYETQGLPGFTGAGPIDRATKAGYNGSVSEVFSASTDTSAADCLASLLDSVYHQNGLLQGWRDVGIAFGPVTGGLQACVLELGVKSGASPQLPNSGTLIAYPAANATQVETIFAPFTEQPQPMPDYTSTMAGEPILASMVTYGAASTYTVTKFVLTDAAGNIVPSRLIANSATVAGAGVTLTTDPNGELAAGQVYLVPLSPLVSGATYRVEFSGTADSTTYSKPWSFTTK